MSKKKHKADIFWIDGILDEQSLSSFSSHSPATNFFQRQLVLGFTSNSMHVAVFGCGVERLWPFGKFMVGRDEYALPLELNGVLSGYVNVPFFKRFSQVLSVLSSIRSSKVCLNDVKISCTFSCQSTASSLSYQTIVAKILRKLFGIPWVCMVGDGLAPNGADAYIIQNISYFQSDASPSPKINFDGGVPRLPQSHKVSRQKTRRKTVFMYMGALTEHGGALNLATAFCNIDNKLIELWYTGRGHNHELEMLASKDKRIRLFGLLSEKDLHEKATQADFFVNPRLPEFAPNKLNFPSKILHYFAYGKPVISTITDGMGEQYNDLIIQTDVTVKGLAEVIVRSSIMSNEDYDNYCEKIDVFRQKNSWDALVKDLINWLLVNGVLR